MVRSEHLGMALAKPRIPFFFSLLFFSGLRYTRTRIYLNNCVHPYSEKQTIMRLLRKFNSLFIATFATFTFLVLLRSVTTNSYPHFTWHLPSNASLSRHSPFIPEQIWWTSETKLEPSFAYVQYATDKAYFCNAVCMTGTREENF